MSSIPHVTLSNGVKQPLIGLGTLMNKDRDELKQTIETALDAGYRYFDTAWYYGNESLIGEIFAEIFKKGPLKREDIFVTTKLPPHRYEPREAEKTFNQQLKDLQTDYVDLYLLHSPCTTEMNEDGSAKMKGEENVPSFLPHIETWRVLEKLYKEGKAKSIGISNFSPKQTQALYDQAEIKPHNTQVELHIYHRQRELVELCKKLNISVTSFATLGSPAIKGVQGNNRVGISVDYPPHGVLGHPLVLELAQKYTKTPGQILLRHLVQLEISVIPKSSNPQRIRENIDILDFKLTADELKRFDDIQEDFRLFVFPPSQNHPWYPFKDGN
ncbi:alcohol dehydrogenase [Aphelenchoides bicaudatus]|nr:alcohol dehydrogenase [Aphelenchoides bicaudatus]